MTNKMLSIFTAIATGLLVLGVVWVTGNNEPALAHGECDTAVSDDTLGDSGSTVADASLDVEVDAGVLPNVSVSAEVAAEDNHATTSTTVRDDGAGDDDTDDSASSTTTTVPSSTSTTQASENEYHRHFLLEIDGNVETISAEDAGSVTVKVVLGHLILVDVNANAGWTYEVKESLLDEVKVRYYKSGIRVDVDVEIDHHNLIVDIDIQTG